MKAALLDEKQINEILLAVADAAMKVFDEKLSVRETEKLVKSIF